ncbi:hypothetical protein BGZ72_008323 [Mortierella alpina]|nr:hypothetical protein BGZ72_008323 [Mortierella alpina]
MPSAAFDAAAEKVKTLKDAKDDTLLELYGLFKQANLGDCTGSRPGLFDPRGRAKYDAYAANKGMSKEDAEKKYIALVESLF